jgi:hypothetical protein
VNSDFKPSQGDQNVPTTEGLADALEGDWEHLEDDKGYRP